MPQWLVLGCPVVAALAKSILGGGLLFICSLWQCQGQLQLRLPQQSQAGYGVVPQVGQIWQTVADQSFEPTELRAELKAGNTYRFLVKTDVTLSPPGQTQRLFSMEQQARYDVGLREAGKGVAVRGITERLKVDIQAAGRSVSYDSLVKNPADAELAKHFEAAVYRYVKMELNTQMKILSRHEAGRQVENAGSPLAVLPHFGPDELVQIVESLPQPFTSRVVAVGDQWQLQGQQPVGELGELSFSIDYRLAEVVEYQRHRCVAIDFYGRLSGELADEAASRVDFHEAQLSGRLLYDPAIQMIRYSDQQLLMVANLPDETDHQKKVHVPLSQKIVLELMQVVPKKKPKK